MTSLSGTPVQVSEKYISEHALPNEQIDAWIKWNKDADYDSIILRTSEPILILSFLNTDEQAFQNNEKGSNEYVIKREWVEVAGFFGVITFYEKIPDDDITIDLTISFIKNGQSIHTEKLSSMIKVPLIGCVNLGSGEIRIGEITTEISLRFELKIMRSVGVRNVKPISRILKSNRNITIDIVADNSEIGEIALNRPYVNDRLIIKGKGFAVIQLAFQYEDFIGNLYNTETLEITIDKYIEEPADIALKAIMNNQVPLLVSS